MAQGSEVLELLERLSSKDLSTLRDTLWPLNKKAEKDEVCEEILENDGIKPLVNCLKVQDLEVRRFTLRTLRFLSAHPAAHDQLRTKGGITALLKVLKTTMDSGNVDFEVTRSTLEVLHNCCPVQANLLVLKDNDALDLFTRCLSVKDAATIQPALRIMSALCDVEDGLDDSADMAVIPVLKCCRDKDAETQAFAAQFLAKFTFTHAEHRGIQRMIAEWHTILNLMSDSNNELAHVSALDIIDNLMATKACFSAVHGMDTFVRVVSMVDAQSDSVQIRALAVISNLCATETGITNLKNSDGIPAILAHLSDRAQIGQRRLALHVLRHVTTNATIRDQMESNDGIALLLRNLHVDDDDRCARAAIVTLSLLIPSYPPDISQAESEFLRADNDALCALFVLMQHDVAHIREHAVALLQGAAEFQRFRRSLAPIVNGAGPDICSDDPDIRAVAFQFYRSGKPRSASNAGQGSEQGEGSQRERGSSLDDEDGDDYTGPEWEQNGQTQGRKQRKKKKKKKQGDGEGDVEGASDSYDEDGDRLGEEEDRSTVSGGTGGVIIEHKHRCVYSAQVQALQAELSLSHDFAETTGRELGLEVAYWRKLAEQRTKEIVEQHAAPEEAKQPLTEEGDGEGAAKTDTPDGDVKKGEPDSSRPDPTALSDDGSVKSGRSRDAKQQGDNPVVVLRAERALLESEVKRMQGELLTVYKREATSMLRINELERMIGQQSSRSLDDQRAQDQEEIASLQAQVALLNGQVEAADISLPQTRVAVLTPIIERHEAYVNLLRKEITSLSRERDALSVRCQSLIHRLSATRGGAGTRDNRHGTAKDGNDSSALQAKIESLSAVNEKLKSELAARQMKLMSLGYADKFEDLKTESGASAAIVQVQTTGRGGVAISSQNAEMLQARVESLEKQLAKKDAVITQLHALVEQYQNETSDAGPQEPVKPLRQLTAKSSSLSVVGESGSSGGDEGGDDGRTPGDNVLTPATATVINSFAEAFELESAMIRQRISDVQLMRRALRQTRIERAAFNTKQPLGNNSGHNTPGRGGHDGLATQRLGDPVSSPPHPQPPKTRTPSARTPKSHSVSQRQNGTPTTPEPRRRMAWGSQTPNSAAAPSTPTLSPSGSTKSLQAGDDADQSAQNRIVRLTRRIDSLKLENARLQGDLHASDAKTQKQGFLIDRQNGENDALRAALVAAKEQLYSRMMSRKGTPPKPPGAVASHGAVNGHSPAQ